MKITRRGFGLTFELACRHRIKQRLSLVAAPEGSSFRVAALSQHYQPWAEGEGILLRGGRKLVLLMPCDRHAIFSMGIAVDQEQRGV